MKSSASEPDLSLQKNEDSTDQLWDHTGKKITVPYISFMFSLLFYENLHYVCGLQKQSFFTIQIIVLVLLFKG